MSCLCCRREGERPQHTYQSACCCYSCCWCVCVHGPLLQCCSKRPVRVRRREGRRDRERESKGGRMRRRGKEGQKRERERDSKEDGGPLPADAVDLILCSIQCVMAASSRRSLSQHSCQWWIRPLQVVSSLWDQQREPFND